MDETGRAKTHATRVLEYLYTVALKRGKSDAEMQTEMEEFSQLRDPGSSQRPARDTLYRVGLLERLMPHAGAANGEDVYRWRPSVFAKIQLGWGTWERIVQAIREGGRWCEASEDDKHHFVCRCCGRTRDEILDKPGSPHPASYRPDPEEEDDDE
jgi:hypothetical protein